MRGWVGFDVTMSLLLCEGVGEWATVYYVYERAGGQQRNYVHVVGELATKYRVHERDGEQLRNCAMG